MSVLGAGLVGTGVLVVVTFLLALMGRRHDRPVRATVRSIGGAHFWYLAVPAWFGGVSGVAKAAAERPSAPLGMWIVSVAILVVGFLVAGLQLVAWWRSRADVDGCTASG